MLEYSFKDEYCRISYEEMAMAHDGQVLAYHENGHDYVTIERICSIEDKIVITKLSFVNFIFHLDMEIFGPKGKIGKDFASTQEVIEGIPWNLLFQRTINDLVLLEKDRRVRIIDIDGPILLLLDTQGDERAIWTINTITQKVQKTTV